MNCEICGNEFCFSWTDTHGIGQCCTCGTPYTIWHYEGEEGNRKRVDKAPEIAVKSEYIPVLKAYWNENKKVIPSGFSFPGGQELAQADEIESFGAWMNENADKILHA